MAKFLRRDAARYSKFGNGKGKKAKYRKPTGRDNKMREKRRGYAPVVSIGYRSEKNTRGLVKDMIPVIVMNASDLIKVKKDEIGVVGKCGQKKRIEIVRKAKELKLSLKNINVDGFLKKLEIKENKK